LRGASLFHKFESLHEFLLNHSTNLFVPASFQTIPFQVRTISAVDQVRIFQMWRLLPSLRSPYRFSLKVPEASFRTIAVVYYSTFTSHPCSWILVPVSQSFVQGFCRDGLRLPEKNVSLNSLLRHPSLVSFLISLLCFWNVSRRPQKGTYGTPPARPGFFCLPCISASF